MSTFNKSLICLFWNTLSLNVLTASNFPAMKTIPSSSKIRLNSFKYKSNGFKKYITLINNILSIELLFIMSLRFLASFSKSSILLPNFFFKWFLKIGLISITFILFGLFFKISIKAWLFPEPISKILSSLLIFYLSTLSSIIFWLPTNINLFAINQNKMNLVSVNYLLLSLYFKNIYEV